MGSLINDDSKNLNKLRKYVRFPYPAIIQQRMQGKECYSVIKILVMKEL